ncbi:MAG: DUF899 family protein [Sneathiellales bacterium]|nr:DUF899 family protein [Sneathiellales bacterium]
MSDLHSNHFPGESTAYRQARNELLQEEIELRKLSEQIAEKRRALPLGGEVQENYEFTVASDNKQATGTVLSFDKCFEEGKETLVLYTLMYGPEAEQACPMCSAFLDGINGETRHLTDRVNFLIAAKSPAERLGALIKERGWDQLSFMSTFGTSFHQDYLSESPDGQQWPMMHVFKKTDKGIFHTYSTELFYYRSDWPGDPRHVDTMWGLWNILDLTPEGRGASYPAL